MPEIAVISAALGSIKTAMDIVKGLRESGASIEKSELKLRLADVIGALADAKMELVEVQEVVAAKESRITELEEAFVAKDTLVRSGDAYYKADTEGVPHGEPFCVRCWTVEHRQRGLVYHASNHRAKTCPACHADYEQRSSQTLP